MGVDKRGKNRIDQSRDGHQFIALPMKVLDSVAYQRLSHAARSLLIEIARQYNRSNNGRLLTTLKYLKTRGWTSADTITRAKRELLDAKLIHETYKGHRPNKASWYALTFYSLDRHENFEPGTFENFRRGSYADNDILKPPNGAGSSPFAPSNGARRSIPAPRNGTVSVKKAPLSTPPHGHPLEKPSVHQ
jgi:hypothetical protein